MNRIKTIGLALVAVFALSAAVTAVASAAEGPFYKVAGSRLLAGETRLLLASASTNFVLASNAGITITCTGLNLPVANEMHIIGSTGANGGRSLEVLNFTGCTVAGNGTKCGVTNQLIITTLVLNLLGYSSSTRAGSAVLVLFAPETGTDFVTVSFTPETGGECKVPSGLVTGNVIGLARSGGANIVVGSNEPAESNHGEVNFSGTVKTIWIEEGGELHSVKNKLELAGIASKLTGTALLLVDSVGGAVPWGVFTA